MRDEIGLTSTFDIREYHNVSDIRPGFNGLSHRAQRTFLQKLQPTDRYVTHNVASTVFLEYLVDELDQNQSVTNQDPERFALGTGNSDPSSGDTGLDNEVGEIAIATVTDNGTTLTMEATLTETELNGNTLEEIAVTNNNAFFYNRALIGPIEKTDEVTVSITGEFGFEAL
jgi:hypothetical protein